MLGLKWLAEANITTFACGEISFASRLAVPMTRDLSRGLPLFEGRPGQVLSGYPPLQC
jgi:hypothetical protein